MPPASDARTGRFSAPSTRAVLGAVAGFFAWPVLTLVLPALPVPVRFLCGWLLFTFGPGAVLTGRLTRDLRTFNRVIVGLGAGSAGVPVLIDLLGRAHLVPLFPYAAAALTGGGIAALCTPGRGRADDGSDAWADAAACWGLVALAAGLGAVVFWHRLAFANGGIVLYGDYDSADLGYYAAVASEAAHTIPPTASYYSGHQLNAAYYPHLVLAMINRFMGVPVLLMHYRYAWPTFLSIGALTAFWLVRAITTRSVAVLAVVLILVGSDFSYLAAWFLPHAAVDWDYLLWPTNFLDPTMQVLHYSTWTPSLPVFFTALYAIVRALQTRRMGWTVLSAFLIGILFEFKPFAYVVLMGALFASAVFSEGDWQARRTYLATLGLGVLFTSPFLLGAAMMDSSDRRTRLVIDFFLLPKRMLIKLDLTKAFADAANRLAPVAALETPLYIFLATVVFLVIGFGIRWMAVPYIWRALRPNRDANAASWRLLGWGVAAGVGVPFVLTTDPYVDTLQFYQTGLFLFWIFTAVALVELARARPRAGRLLAALAIAATLPSSLHYLDWKWTERERDPRAALSRSEVAITDYLRGTDPETTVILHDRPLSPSLTTIVAARRIVLGWDVRYSAVGGEGRLRDVNAFFVSAGGDPAAAMEILRRYHVTHLIVRREGDRVHPEVLAQLKQVLQFPDVALYEVPQLPGS